MAVWLWPNTIITKVIDGDTVDAHVTRDLGFEGTASFPVRLRLMRINAPRSNTVRGRAAKARVAALTEAKTVEITTVKGYKYGAPPNMTGEYMAEIRLPDGDNLSDLLVREGLAAYWDGAGPRPEDE